MKIRSILLCYLITTGTIICQNYKMADTLFVVTLNGLNLRDNPSENSPKLARLETGDKVVILEDRIELSDSIFGFKGNWVRIKSVAQNISGFVFDPFISKYPVLSNFKTINELKASKWETGGLYEFMPAYLEEYSKRAFPNIQCQVEYDNGEVDQGGHGMIISKLKSGDNLINHMYYESYATELELNNARNSEVYYIILNLLQELPKGMYKIDEAKIRTPKYGSHDFYYDNCVVKCGDYCTVMLIKKDKHKYGIFLYFTY